MRTAFAATVGSLFVLRACAEPGLTLALIVSSEGSHSMTAKITNTGTETLKLLNEPHSVLSDVETETFTLSSAKGAPRFKGIRMKYSPESVVRDNDPKSFTVLKPGQSHEVTHHLPRAYDFSETGIGEYQVEAQDTFTSVDSLGELTRIKATVEPAIFKLTTPMLPERDFRPRGSSLVARQTSGPQFVGCSSSQQNIIKGAIVGAERYIDSSLDSLNKNPRGSPRSQMWFGAYDANRYATVKDHFEKIRGRSNQTTYHCTGCIKPDADAYVYPAEPGKVFLCDKFWYKILLGADSQAGTLIHEQTHFNDYGGTRDFRYGQEACKVIAKSAPNAAILNADNHEYFAENPSRALLSQVDM